uniref:Uncharacterized protein n=1 Tax=Craspedostauros australis TaxID=1486917 RepID=A0A7R9WYI6_9STRA
MGKVLFFPFHVLIRCKDLVVNVVLLPFQVLNRAGQATQTMWTTCVDGAVWLLHLPGNATRSVLVSIQRAAAATTSMTMNSLHAVLSNFTNSQAYEAILRSANVTTQLYSTVMDHSHVWKEFVSQLVSALPQTSRRTWHQIGFVWHDVHSEVAFRTVSSLMVVRLLTEEGVERIQRYLHRLVLPR